MPIYMFNNNIDDTAWVRLYDPVKYTARTKLYDPYFYNFTVDNNSTQAIKEHTQSVTFKVVLLGDANIRSGNQTFSKRSKATQQEWESSRIAIDLDIKDGRVTLTV